MRGTYYSSSLSAERLKKCYDIAPPRVKRYLQAEIEVVVEHLNPGFIVLELGCGYGRAMAHTAPCAGYAVGIDISMKSLELAKATLAGRSPMGLVCSDASFPCFKDGQFDLIYCIQNGISAFHADKRCLIESTVQYLRPGGTALFSTYAHQFWEQRLAWFRLQANQGLIGRIDEGATGDGVIVCSDGFEAHTVGSEEFEDLTRHLNARTDVFIVEDSSLFCRIRVPQST